MRIAVPTDDGVNLSSHFGRSRGFLIFEARDGRVALVETRPNAGCHGHGGAVSGEAAAGHGHAPILDVLGDCRTAICSGIGPRAVEALEASGISVVLVEAAGDAERIVAAYQSGALQPAPGGLCQCNHQTERRE